MLLYISVCVCEMQPNAAAIKWQVRRSMRWVTGKRQTVAYIYKLRS